MTPVAPFGRVAENEGAAVNYRRGRNGDWDVPQRIDRDDPRVRLILTSPAGPLIVELRVFVDGLAFRAMREHWIDEGLASSGPFGDASAGTGQQNDDSVQSASEDAINDVSDTESETPALEVAGHRMTDARERLSQYVSRSRIPVERDEARWLLAEWVPGPALLEVRPDFAADRAQMAPLWSALDEDGNQHLSAAELSVVTKRLTVRDANEDDWIDLRELSGGRSPVVRGWAPLSLATVLSGTTDWEALRRQMIAVYRSQTSQPLLSRILQDLRVADLGSLTQEKLEQLRDVTPDAVIEVKFSTSKAEEHEMGVSVISLGGLLNRQGDALQAAEQVISLSLDGCVLEFAAAQVAGLSAEGWNSQIAVGAVMDGFPLMRLVDTDFDRRLSLRELEAIPKNLSDLDSNGDGELEQHEIPSPLRLVVTLGPHAHDVLKSPVAASVMSRPTRAPAPEWFASMDENNDNDLTPAEFLGTREQFKGLDQDGNGRISASEAAMLNP